jgi:RNA polymerase sigma-70 factor (ECF subfamily)
VLTRPEPAHRDLDLESHRRALTGYCYRMLGSGSEAEDAVQETMIRAWRNAGGLQSDEALKAWMYRIATNVCLDMLRGAQRRARPVGMGPSSTVETAVLGPELPESAFVQPVPDGSVLPDTGDPAELAAQRETIRLAFVAALQHLPPRQRAVLILREVLRWKASEVAELLDTSTASVNSALQRARATLDQVEPDPTGPVTVDGEHAELLDRYVAAFETYDISSLVTLLHDDATFSMPPYPLWLRGPAEVGKWMLGPGIVCQGSRLLTTRASGVPAVGIYHPTADGFAPYNLALIEVRDDRIAGIHNYLYPGLFPAFGLPEQLEA